MAANKKNKRDLFDRWSTRYDTDVDAGTFPFVGYQATLSTIIRLADFEPNHRVLDLGVGTGNLAKRVPLPAHQIWCADFSAKMLENAQKTLPESQFFQVDLRDEFWPPEMKGPFDRIISAYTFHEFSNRYKIALIQRLFSESLAPGGLLVIGDISFKTRRHFDAAHQAYRGLWDEAEYYWCAGEMIQRLQAAGFNTAYEQVSACGGAYRILFKVS